MKILDLQQFFPYQLSALERHISQAIAQHYMSDFELSRMEWRVMATLAMFESITARQVCDFTGMDKMQASRAIKRMQQVSLIEHKKNHQDKRSRQLSLTSTGQKMYQQIIPLVKQEEQHILSLLNETEQKQLRHIINKLERSLS